MYVLDDQSPWIRRKVRSSNIPLRYLGRTLDDLDPYKGDVIEKVKSYIEEFSSGAVLKAEGMDSCGKGLLLAGAPGSGKTALSSVIAQEILRNSSKATWKEIERPVFFVTYPEYLLSLQKSFGTDEESLESVAMSAGLLILDDLGKEHRTSSGWSEATFDSLLRIRFDRGLPTFITTNVPISKWGTVYGEAMESFAHEALRSLVIIAPEGDRRK